MSAAQLQQLAARLAPPRPRGLGSDTDGAVCAPDELRLSVLAPHVQAAHKAAPRAGQAVLSERGRVDPCRTLDIRIERAAEESAFTHVRGRREQQCTVNAGNK